MDINDRLRKAILLKNKTLKKFALNAGISYVTLQRYLSGKRQPNVDALLKINNHLDVSLDWLLTGKGSMYLEEEKGINKSPKWLTDWWQKSDDEHKHWLKIQLNQTPPVTK